MKITVLTVENCKSVDRIISIAHPEWGDCKFNYKGQPLNDGEYTHTRGTGSNSAILNESDFKYWAVVSFK